jgi:ATP phosphoribosyltransferase
MRIGIAKGRGFAECLEMVAATGIELPRDFRSGRLTIVDTGDVRVVAARGSDLPWLLREGHVDVAAGSSVWFEEASHPAIAEAVELDLCRCRLSLIAPEHASLRRVCTRFPNLTRKGLARRAPEAELVFLAGSNEIALTMGFADAIVDIVETGWTLRRFSLGEVEVLLPVHHAIWTRRGETPALAFAHALESAAVPAG